MINSGIHSNYLPAMTVLICLFLIVSDDWMTAAATLSKLLPSLSEEIQPNVKRVFISSAVDTTTESTLLIQVNMSMYV